MKRFLSVLLTAAMLLTVCMPVFADAPEMHGGMVIATEGETAVPKVSEEPGVTENEESDAPKETALPTEEDKDDAPKRQSISLMSMMKAADSEASYSTDNGNTWTDGSFDEAWDAVSKAGITAEIKILKDITITSKKEVYAGADGTADITLTAEGTVTIFRGAGLVNDPVFRILGASAGGATLTLGKEQGMDNGGTLIFDGAKVESTHGYFYIEHYQDSKYGTLNMHDGVTIQNAVKIQGDSLGSGGAAVFSNGEFNMYGGTISDCELKSAGSGAMESGGAVCVSQIFNMYAGTIKNCTSVNKGGAVAIVGYDSGAVFNMYGGTITQNTAGEFSGGAGGGVILGQTTVKYGGKINISGGSIAGNSVSGSFAKGKDIAVTDASSELKLSASCGDKAEIYLDGNTKVTVPSGSTLGESSDVITLQSNQTSDGRVLAVIEGGQAEEYLGNFRALNYGGTDIDIKANDENNAIIIGKTDYEVLYSTDGTTWKGSALAAAVSAIGTGTGTIKVLKDIEFAEEITVKGNITMLADTDVTLKRTSSLTEKPMLAVEKIASLTLGQENGMSGSITIDGGAVWANDYPTSTSQKNTGVKSKHCLILSNGTLNMYDNVVLQNNQNANDDMWEQTKYGAGVANYGGTFNMYGGKIWKCDSYSGMDNGGAVNNNGADSSIMLPGTAVFNMYGGEICYNYAGAGGGVLVGSPNYNNDPMVAATFNMTGGKIHHNESSDVNSHCGGGVYVNKESTFNMSGGEISENKSTEFMGVGSGGGVDGKGKLIVSENAIIRNNTADGYGDDISYGSGAGGNSASNFTLNSTVTIDGIDNNIKWYTDGVVDVELDEITTGTRYSEDYRELKADFNIDGMYGLKAVYSPAGNAVTIDPAIANGSVNVTGADDFTAVPAGTELTVSATPNENYKLSEIKVYKTGDETTTVSVDADGKFTMPDYGVTVTAVFAGKAYLQFIANGTTKGTIAEANEVVTKFGTIAITPEPAVENVDLDFMTKTQTVAYEGETYTLTATALDSATVKDIYISYNNGTSLEKVKVEGTITDGKTGAVTLTPEMISAAVQANSSFTQTINFYVTFEAKQTLTVGKQKKGVTIFNVGTLSSSTDITTDHYTGDLDEGTHLVPQAGTVYLYAAGESFKGFKLTRTDTGAVIEQTPGAIGWTTYQHNEGPEYYGFTMPNYGVTVELVCGYNVNITTPENGSVTASPTSADVGEKITLTVSPAQNYELENLAISYDTNQAITPTKETDGTYTFTMPEDDVTVTAAFQQSAFAVTVAENIANGQVSVDKTMAVQGETVSVTATPDANYVLDAIIVTKQGGGTVDVSETGTFAMPGEPVTVRAAFVKKTFNIATSANAEEGEITLVGGTASAAWGEAVTFHVTAKTHYEIDAVTVKGSDNADVAYTYDEASDTYQFTMPTQNVTISATFKKTKYTVTTAGEHVTFVPVTDTVEWGSVVTIGITPEQWYQLTDITTMPEVAITDNGDGTYSFTMPQNDIAITATAQRPNFSVTFESKGGTVIDPKVIANGDLLVKPAVPERVNYGFAGWYLDENYTKKYDFSTPVTDDVTLYARWFLWGDVNGDGRTDTIDSMLIKRYSAQLIGLDKLAIPMAARVSRADKAIPDTVDSMLIKRFSAKLITRFPVETINKGYEYDLENDIYDAPGI